MERGLCTFSAEYPPHTVGARGVPRAGQHLTAGYSTTSLTMRMIILIFRAKSGYAWTYLVQSEFLSENPYQVEFKEIESSPPPIPQLHR